MSFWEWLMSHLLPPHLDHSPPSIEPKVKRLKHCVQCHRSVMGFVVIVKLLEVPARRNPFPWHVRAQHVGDCTTSPKQDFVRSQLPSWDTWEHHRVVSHSKWESPPASPAVQGQGYRQESCSGRDNRLPFIEGKLCYQPDSKAATKAPQQTWGRPALHPQRLHPCQLPSSLQGSIFSRQLHPVCPMNCCDWPCTGNAGTCIQLGKGSWGERLNNRTSCPELTMRQVPPPQKHSWTAQEGTGNPEPWIYSK